MRRKRRRREGETLTNWSPTKEDTHDLMPPVPTAVKNNPVEREREREREREMALRFPPQKSSLNFDRERDYICRREEKRNEEK
jgi:hypothetical protein